MAVQNKKLLNGLWKAKLHATLVHMKNGNHYLRPEHGQHSFVVIT